MTRKQKIVIFGAADFIVHATRNMLRPENCEIIAFADNNKEKQGLLYEGVPVLSPSALMGATFDYVVVGAWASYGTIRDTLLKLGLPDEKILPLLSLESISAMQGITQTISRNTLRTIFQGDTEALAERLEEAKILYRHYEQMPSFGDWEDVHLPSSGLIAHAGGGWIREKKCMYSNSEEAFVTSLEAGFQVFEFDVWGICGDDIIFAHDSERYSAFPNKGFHPLTFNNMVALAKERADLHIILDIKWENMEEYSSILKKIDELATKLSWQEQARRQLIIETYDKNTSLHAVQNGWHIWLTSYRNSDGLWYTKSIASICGNAGVKTMMLPVSIIL